MFPTNSYPNLFLYQPTAHIENPPYQPLETSHHQDVYHYIPEQTVRDNTAFDPFPSNLGGPQYQPIPNPLSYDASNSGYFQWGSDQPFVTEPRFINELTPLGSLSQTAFANSGHTLNDFASFPATSALPPVTEESIQDAHQALLGFGMTHPNFRQAERRLRAGDPRYISAAKEITKIMSDAPASHHFGTTFIHNSDVHYTRLNNYISTLDIDIQRWLANCHNATAHRQEKSKDKKKNDDYDRLFCCLWCNSTFTVKHNLASSCSYTPNPCFALIFMWALAFDHRPHTITYGSPHLLL
ncbi:hypothetical protein CVT24_003082 [Panaeolus cyanescens]|uniref:Uncharacterized protein n=1 Tax=Panaeolus cyanescens TaxID=181874 RepID=A0A409VU93_9AGAR|nr:hypothetical protein CVT24_003082 [Panaeolus cyanescens]